MSQKPHASLRKVLFTVGAMLAVLGFGLVLGAPNQDAQAAKLAQDRATPTPSATVDHTAIAALEGPFDTPQEVTKVCLACHSEVGNQILQTTHWTWEFENEATGQILGKKTLINNYCISIQSNEPRCTSCHIGYGWKDKTFDFSAQENIDCLVCHDTTGTYKKFPTAAGLPMLDEAREFKGKTFEPVDLAYVAQNIGKTSIATCGSCHFYGGGGNEVKHGDLDNSLVNAAYDLDVHMSPDGGNFTCTTCHVTQEHDIAGSRYSMNPEEWKGCESCHTEAPHPLALLNHHTSRIACQTCHISEFARGGVATKMFWDWSQAGRLVDGKPVVERDANGYITYDGQKGQFAWEENVVPEYLWFNGVVQYTLAGDVIDTSTPLVINQFLGNINEPNARIWPVKRFEAITPYDSGFNTLAIPHLFPANPDDQFAYWKSYDWNAAISYGMDYAGLPYSGQYGWLESVMYWPTTHMVAPADGSLQCRDCHKSEGGRLDFAALGYNAADVSRLTNFPPVLTIELEAAPQNSPETCQECHAQQYDIWTESVHSTKGVGCVSCHTLEGEQEHPLSPYTSSRSADVCGACHLNELRDWQDSVHGEMGLTCATCHEPHAQYQRLVGDNKTACESCHREEVAASQHGTHNIAGFDCLACHMNTELNTGHTFEIALDTCLKCHGENVHSADALVRAGIDVSLEEAAKAGEGYPEEPVEPAEEAPTGTGIGLPAWLFILLGILMGTGTYWLLSTQRLAQSNGETEDNQDQV
jgi:octaheme c-type cytochrome (tetrathionate reductase family)